MVIVCLSRESINKKGYVQKEIKYALDVADEQPEDAIFLIPLRLEPCKIPDRLSRWHCVDFFAERGFERLMRSLRRRTLEAKGLGDVPNFLSLELDSIREEHVHSLLEILHSLRKETYWVRIDKESTIVDASNSFAALLGFTKESILGTEIVDLVVPLEVEPMKLRFVPRTKNRKAIFYFTELQNKQGNTNRQSRKVVVYAFPILNKDDVYVGSFAILVPLDKIETRLPAALQWSELQ